MQRLWRSCLASLVLMTLISRTALAQVLDKAVQLQAQTFWDNRDWDWYQQNIPFFECPDADLTTTYYYRWELLTKHLTYGSPNSGYSFTEFIDRPFWSGAYGAISCPAGHQLYEARWLRQPTVARDYLKYWFRTPGSQPRNYSTWLADSAIAVHQVHPDGALLIDLLPDLIAHYEGWEKRHYVPEIGLFWQTGHDDGMEFNINSRQTKDILRGAPSYRPSFNAYMWADAVAIAKIARMAQKTDVTQKFDTKAASLKTKMLELLWDSKRQFFFPVYKNDEERDGHKIKALTKTYESGQFAGDEHGRELIGYVPWQFQMIEPGRGYESAWTKLMQRDGFFSDFGPSTVERNDPMFLLKNSCCWWSGQSWPYATTQTLKAMSQALRSSSGNNSHQLPISKADFVKLLTIYSKSHRKQGKPYLAEALHPDTGSFDGHDGYNHSEHYFHSGFCDVVISDLVGLITRDDDTLEVNPLAPADWDYFALDDVPYHDHCISVLWDKTGERYRRGRGLHVLVDGKAVAHSEQLARVEVPRGAVLPDVKGVRDPRVVDINYAVNNDGDYFPRVSVSHTGPRSSPAKLIDGNYWYHRDPPNRWTTEGSPNASDWVELDLGIARRVWAAKLYFLDDEKVILPPSQFTIETWRDDQWQPLLVDKANVITNVTGHRPTVVKFKPQDVTKLRVTFTHATQGRTGLTEIELWGDAQRPIVPAPAPKGNLAYRSPLQKDGFPKISASHTSRFDKVEMANDGRIIYGPTPHNRWTSYESKSPTDWLELDFGDVKEVQRVNLHFYDDRGGVQAPTSYVVESWTGTEWKAVANAKATPEMPTGGVMNTVRFDAVQTSKLRVVFTHKAASRSGVTEIEIWNSTATSN